jgi:hypothetical protein
VPGDVKPVEIDNVEIAASFLLFIHFLPPLQQNLSPASNRVLFSPRAHRREPERTMADFVQNSETRNAVRELTSPIPVIRRDLSDLSTTIFTLMAKNYPVP